MTKHYVIIETESKVLDDTPKPHVLGVTTSQELAVTLIQKRHPTLVTMEYPAGQDQLKFTMECRRRGLYFLFDVSPFESDPADLGEIVYDEKEVEEPPDEDYVNYVDITE
ncbi:MAG: hypothetical protein P4L53_04770 [Candidatus Obscuribacterales bacterium]|nr:hypothetical protein [Candidatus Obscuribacterales bacterium]